MLRPHFLRVKTLRNRPKFSHKVLWCCLVNPGTMEWRRPYTVGWWLKGWWLRWHQVADISIWGWFIKPFPLVHVTIVRHFCLWWDWYMSLCIELIIKNQPKNVGKKTSHTFGASGNWFQHCEISASTRCRRLWSFGLCNHHEHHWVACFFFTWRPPTSWWRTSRSGEQNLSQASHWRPTGWWLSKKHDYQNGYLPQVGMKINNDLKPPTSQAVFWVFFLFSPKTLVVQVSQRHRHEPTPGLWNLEAAITVFALKIDKNAPKRNESSSNGSATFSNCHLQWLGICQPWGRLHSGRWINCHLLGWGRKNDRSVEGIISLVLSNQESPGGAFCHY